MTQPTRAFFEAFSHVSSSAIAAVSPTECEPPDVMACSATVPILGAPKPESGVTIGGMAGVTTSSFSANVGIGARLGAGKCGK